MTVADLLAGSAFSSKLFLKNKIELDLLYL